MAKRSEDDSSQKIVTGIAVVSSGAVVAPKIEEIRRAYFPYDPTRHTRKQNVAKVVKTIRSGPSPKWGAAGAGALLGRAVARKSDASPAVQAAATGVGALGGYHIGKSFGHARQAHPQVVENVAGRIASQLDKAIAANYSTFYELHGIPEPRASVELGKKRRAFLPTAGDTVATGIGETQWAALEPYLKGEDLAWELKTYGKFPKGDLPSRRVSLYRRSDPTYLQLGSKIYPEQVPGRFLVPSPPPPLVTPQQIRQGNLPPVASTAQPKLKPGALVGAAGLGEAAGTLGGSLALHSIDALAGTGLGEGFDTATADFAAEGEQVIKGLLGDDTAKYESAASLPVALAVEAAHFVGGPTTYGAVTSLPESIATIAQHYTGDEVDSPTQMNNPYRPRSLEGIQFTRSVHQTGEGDWYKDYQPIHQALWNKAGGRTDIFGHDPLHYSEDQARYMIDLAKVLESKRGDMSTVLLPEEVGAILQAKIGLDTPLGSPEADQALIDELGSDFQVDTGLTLSEALNYEGDIRDAAYARALGKLASQEGRGLLGSSFADVEEFD